MTGCFGKGSGRRLMFWALICCLLAAGPLVADEPLAAPPLAEKPDSLARLVPATAGLCIEADDLAGRWPGCNAERWPSASVKIPRSASRSRRGW